jgi:AcrR family transcriptional regulator
MARDADRTRKRLLEAAGVEFSALGIAGARVDRIAEAAGCNKAMIYAYFGNKDQLFDAVFSAHVAAFLDEVPFDAPDLPGYAGRLFDRYEDHPETLRLATWYRLERPRGASLQAVVSSNQGKLDIHGLGVDDPRAGGERPGRSRPSQIYRRGRRTSAARRGRIRFRGPRHPFRDLFLTSYFFAPEPYRQCIDCRMRHGYIALCDLPRMVHSVGSEFGDADRVRR